MHIYLGKEGMFMSYYLYLIAKKRKKEREDARSFRDELLSDNNDALADLSKSIPFQSAYI
jgi:hypothetical protein